ncbi:MAG: YkyA family protein [Ectobacillus sp.]
MTAGAILLLLTGCFGPKPEEELYVIFENAAKQEKGMFKSAAQLEKIETENKELYNKILQDGKEDNQTVQSIIDKAVQGVNDRKKIVDDERDMLKKAQQEMKESKEYIKDLQEAGMKAQAKKVVNLYKERYETFEEMHAAYKKALVSEKELYHMLQAKEEKLKTISDKVKEVNKLYENVGVKNEKFNQYTEQYNQEKVAFYKQADFKIEAKK